MSQIDLIIQYESGELDDQQVVFLFADLVRTGQAWVLQGHYGRTAQRLIEAGWIDKKGNVSLEVFEL
jgi:hypothetical protein